MFDKVRNNVIDVVKPEEIDTLIKEGLVEHNDDSIQVQGDVMMYLIHNFNSRCFVLDKDGKSICRATNFRKSK